MELQAVEVEEKRMAFMLQYILNARLSGRSADTDSTHERSQLVNAANDLYDQVMHKCTILPTEL